MNSAIPACNTIVITVATLDPTTSAPVTFSPPGNALLPESLISGWTPSTPTTVDTSTSSGIMLVISGNKPNAPSSVVAAIVMWIVGVCNNEVLSAISSSEEYFRFEVGDSGTAA